MNCVGLNNTRMCSDIAMDRIRSPRLSGLRSNNTWIKRVMRSPKARVLRR